MSLPSSAEYDGDREVRTKTIREGGSEVTWNEDFVIECDDDVAELRLEVWHKSGLLLPDALVATAKLPLSHAVDNFVDHRFDRMFHRMFPRMFHRLFHRMFYASWVELFCRERDTAHVSAGLVEIHVELAGPPTPAPLPSGPPLLERVPSASLTSSEVGLNKMHWVPDETTALCSEPGCGTRVYTPR